ncbi:MAG: polymer-forming cytoskeletal protein [Myxococcales bacterium]|nr:polymer-forming cytoskeletal protein [Myxococcales bacterium]
MAAPISRGQTAASVLAEGLTLTGRVAGSGDLEVRGHLEGEVDLQGELTLAEGATVRANVSATRVVVRGALLGDVRAGDSIVLEASARVVGDLTSPRISIALGAQIRGNLDMSEAETARIVPAARPAPVSRPVENRASAPAARPMAQKGPITPAKPVAVTRKPAPVVAVAPAPAAEEAPAADEPKADAPRKEPPSPVVPAIKKGQKAQPKRKAHEAK